MQELLKAKTAKKGKTYYKQAKTRISNQSVLVQQLSKNVESKNSNMQYIPLLMGMKKYCTHYNPDKKGTFSQSVPVQQLPKKY